MELITDERNILLAYRNIKRNKGSNTPGVNGKTIKSLGNWSSERLVRYVRNRLRNYLPMKVKFKEIPKANGNMRPLGIPTIEDRLIQKCIKQILEPICEAKFHPHSYGFRPNRSTANAIARFNILVNKSKLHYVVDVDIKGFFDNVNHGKLLKQMWTFGIKDKNLLCVISKMLKAEVDGKGIPHKGTPQGGILSPLLSNIVLNELDWWISDQWETFETRHKYAKGHKDRALKTTNLKEIRIIRYADDFKILCRDYKTAQKIFVATKEWLKERLHLEISPEKSKVVNLRKRYSEFLGFKLKVRPKSKKYVITSHMADSAKSRVKKELKRKIKYLNTSTTLSSVNMFNATVLGVQNYYKIASNISLDMYRIGYDVSKRLYNQTCKKSSPKGTKSKAYEKFYKSYNFKVTYLAGVALYPVQGIRYQNAMAFTQKVCNYTEQGRNLIHSRVRGIDVSILRHLMNHPVKNQSTEYNDNRISLYCGQLGKCHVTGQPLIVGEMHVHHKIPKNSGGLDEYRNLVFINSNVHRLIHAVEVEVIDKYIRLTKPDTKSLGKINKLRILVGNCEI